MTTRYNPPLRAEIDRVADILIAECERVEGLPVNVSYRSTFANMARAIIADRAASAERVRSVVRDACMEYASSATMSGRHGGHAAAANYIASRVAEQLALPDPTPLTPDEVKHLRHRLADWRVGDETSVSLVERLLNGAGIVSRTDAAATVGLSAEDLATLRGIPESRYLSADEAAVLDRMLAAAVDLRAVIVALLDNDAPAGDLRRELARLIGRV
jgi:hypothetical protein